MSVVRRFIAVCALMTSLGIASCTAPLTLDNISDFIPASEMPPPPGPITVRMVADEIDKLEKHIDKYGSVVPKQADVWGQARLMMHRQEYELAMRRQLDQFKTTLQGSLARSDQAFLARRLHSRRLFFREAVAVRTPSWYPQNKRLGNRQPLSRMRVGVKGW